jgi:hypothetical protein
MPSCLEKDGKAGAAETYAQRKKLPFLSNLPYGLWLRSYKLLLALALVELGCVMRGDDPVSP